MAIEKLVLPPIVRAKLVAERKAQEKNQAEVAYEIDELDEELFGHYETGKRPVPKSRFWKWVQALDQTDETALDWWRLAIQERINELLADGGVPADDRAHVLWTVANAWAARDPTVVVPRQARAAGTSR